MTPLLSLSGLHKRFPGVDWVVRDVALEVTQGEILSVLGPSGCGKTTLLRLIAGFEHPDQGEIRYEGEVISRPGWALPPEKRGIGMVFQEYTLFPHLTVRENVQFGLTPSLGERMRGWWSREPSPGENGREALARRRSKQGLVELMALCGLSDMRDRYPHELSGGQQQRVALARALATAPHLLLLDEPFSNLDTALRVRLREEVRAILKRAGATAILVTHDQEEAVNMGDRLAVMNRGRLEQLDTPEAVLRQPRNRFVASFIGMNRFIPGRVEGGMVETELGRLPLPPPGGGTSPLPPGTPVDVVLRPSQVHFCANGGGSGGGEQEPQPPGVDTEVVRVQYLSGQPMHTLALPSGLEIQALLPEAEGLRPGARARVRFEPSPLVVFPAE